MSDLSELEKKFNCRNWFVEKLFGVCGLLVVALLFPFVLVFWAVLRVDYNKTKGVCK